MGVRTLSIEQLDQLETRCRALGAPVVELLQPGLADAQMDELTRPLGFRLPAEARTWWGWHNGAAGGDRIADRELLGSPFLPLESAVAVYQRERSDLVRAWSRDGSDAPGGADFWPANWLPITLHLHGDFVVIECEEGRETAPVHHVSLEDPQVAPVPKAASLGEFAAMCITAIDVGVWFFSQEQGRWCRGDEPADSSVRFSPLL